MKKQAIIPILFAAAAPLLTSCSSSPTAEQYLKNDAHRKDVILSISHNQPYKMEMMQEMMQSDSNKHMMMGNMMGDPSMAEMHMDKMMNICKDDSTKFKMMLGKTMEMCDIDPAKCKMMTGSMQSYKNVMNSMKGMDNMKY